MAIFDDWAKFTVQVLQAESDLSKALVDHPVLLGDARETIIRSILARILPSAFEIGRGQIVDSDGKRSKQIDIVIARRDSPALSLPSGDKLYLIEAVLATIEVKSNLTKTDLIGALENCASVADLAPQVHGPSASALRKKLNIKATSGGTLYHEDYLELQRYFLKAYPATYIYGFKGYPQRYRDLADVVIEWLEEKKAQNRSVLLRHLPSVIATEGCFGCRNALPLFNFLPDKPGEKPLHFYFGQLDEADPPLRLLVSHLLATLYAKIPWLPDIEGLQMEPRRHIAQMKLPQGRNGEPLKVWGIGMDPPDDYLQTANEIYWEGFS